MKWWTDLNAQLKSHKINLYVTEIYVEDEAQR